MRITGSKPRVGAGFAFSAAVVAFAVSCTLTQGLDDYDRCGVDEKDCGGTCHKKSDPLFGCAAAECTPCTFANTTGATCDAVGSCKAGDCSEGFATCGSSAEAICATNLSTDVKNCGACGKTCSNVNGALAACVGGQCTVPTEVTCDVGPQNCDNVADNGCECSFPNALAQCGTGGLSDGGGGTSSDASLDATSSDAGSSDAAPVDVPLDGGGGACTFGQCKIGFAHCSGDVTKVGCEVSTQADENNCGRCGKKCDGGACVAGVCQPFALATNQPFPGQIIFADGNVYWTNFGSATAPGNVAKVRLDGPPVTVVAPGIPSAWGIGELGTELFYTAFAATPASNVLGRAPKDPTTGSPKAMATIAGRVRGIAIDPNGQYVYFAVYDASVPGTTYVQGIYRIDRVAATATPELFATAVRPNTILVDGTNVYWTNEGTTALTGSVQLAPKAATIPVTPTVVGSALNRTRGLAIDADTIYWANAGSVGGRDGSIEKRRKDLTSDKVSLATGLADSRELAVDPGATDYVYWASYKDNTVSRVLKSPASSDVPQLVAQNPTAPATPSLNLPLSVAVDGKYVYWSNFGTAGAPGGIMRLVKP